MKRSTAIAVTVAAAVIAAGFAGLIVKLNRDMKAYREGSGAPSFFGAEKPAYGDTFVGGSIGDASILNPILSGDSASNEIISKVYNGLVKYDKDLKLTGDLAESWVVSKDGLVVTFKLRKNVKWQDGVEFTAADVEFTYRKLTDPLTKSPYKSSFELLKKFEMLDKYTVRVTYGKPFAPALESWGMGILPEHVYKGLDVNTAPANYSPVGTGPYIFKDWKRQREIKLSSFPGYFDGRAYIDNYVYRIIPDQSVQFMELKSGGLDEMALTPDMFKKQATAPEFEAKFNKYRYRAMAYTYMGFNNASPFFSDRKVRQAVSHAINRKEIIDFVLFGYGVEATGPFPPESWACDRSVKGYSLDLELSKKLLFEAGWLPGKDGMLEKNGKKFSFMLMTNQGNKERESIATIIQSQLKKLGIKVELRVLAWPVFINEYVNKKKFDAVVLGWSLTPDPDCYDIFHSSKTKEGEYNFVSYSNPDVDRLLIEGRETFDQNKRKELYARIHKLIAEDQPYAFLYVPDALVAIDKRIHGIKPAPIGIGYNFEKWFVPFGEQKYRTKTVIAK